MIWPRHIEVIREKFKHADDLLIVFLYKEYVFGIVKEIIPKLKLPQVTVGEMEQVLATEGGEAKLEALLAARCIFTPDKAAEIKVCQELKDDAYHESIITKGEIQQLIKGEIERIYVPLAEDIKKNLKDVQASRDLDELLDVRSEPEKPKKPEKPGKQMSILDAISKELQEEE